MRLTEQERKEIIEGLVSLAKAPARLAGHQTASMANKAKHRMSVATGKAPMGSNWK
jgi:hypothetical protein